MSCTPDTVKRIAPEFASLDATTILQPFIDETAPQVNAAIFASSVVADLAVAYLTAHRIALAYPKLYGGGTVQSVRVGAVGASFAVPMQQLNTPLAATRFGVEFLRMVRNTGQGIQGV